MISTSTNAGQTLTHTLAERRKWLIGVLGSLLSLVACQPSKDSPGQPMSDVASSRNRWKGDYSDKECWLQYGDHDTGQMVVSFVRWLDTHNVPITIHDASQAVLPNTKVPGFATFALETGEGDETLAMEGWGSFFQFDDGTTGFSINNNGFDSDDYMEMIRGVLKRVQAGRQNLRILINDWTLELPYTEGMILALNRIFSPKKTLINNLEQLRTGPLT